MVVLGAYTCTTASTPSVSAQHNHMDDGGGPRRALDFAASGRGRELAGPAVFSRRQAGPSFTWSAFVIEC